MTSHLEVLVEELSCERALTTLLPGIVPETSFEIRIFNGKPDLLRKLTARLAGYANWMREADLKIVIILDRDDDDCIALKSTVEDMVRDAGLVTLAARRSGQAADVCVRIVVEELEAWFFGDVPALRAAYPRLPASLSNQRPYRDPDAIAGGTAQALERLLAKHGYAPTLAKVANATEVAHHMDVENNRSRSFQVLRNGVRRLVAAEVRV